MNVYAIKVLGGKYAGAMVATVEEPPAGTFLPRETAERVVAAWVHRAGLPPEAAAGYRAEFVPVTAWRDVARAGEPIHPASGVLTRPEVVELVDRLRVASATSVMRTDAEARAAREDVTAICRILLCPDADAVYEKYGRYPGLTA